MKRLLKNRLYMLAFAAFLIVLSWVFSNYTIVFNRSESLPINGVFIKKNKLPNIDDLFVFKVINNPNYKLKEVKFIKILAGKEGDIITSDNERRVFVNGKEIGVAKTKSLKNKPLEKIESGIIPPHKFFSAGIHKDSYDSRYKEIGLIDEKNIVGTAIFVW